MNVHQTLMFHHIDQIKDHNHILSHETKYSSQTYYLYDGCDNKNNTTICNIENYRPSPSHHNRNGSLTPEKCYRQFNHRNSKNSQLKIHFQKHMVQTINIQQIEEKEATVQDRTTFSHLEIDCICKLEVNTTPVQ